MSATRLTEVVPGVLVATARAYSTLTTALLDGSGGAVVVDPAWYPDELEALPADLAALNLTCVAGVATHEHYDHILWHPELGEVPRWTSPQTAHHMAVDRPRLVAPAAEFLSPDLIAVAGRLDPLPGLHLPWDGPDVACLVHDAHAPGHLALLHEPAGVLLAGDMLSDIELPMPADSDTTLETYYSGLLRLRDAVGTAGWLIPGHGTPTDAPQARFDADLRYLDRLLAGEPCDDPRLGNPGMAELHEANCARAQAT